MKKLTVLVAVILIVSLFAGCDFLDWIFGEKLTIPEVDGIVNIGEWDDATEISVAGDIGIVKVLATTDYLYVLFDVVDSTDARLGENIKANDQTSINVNPTDGGSWGFPYDLIFETSADLPWDSKVNSGITDGWNTRWFPNDIQKYLPGDLESATEYSGTNRVTEWKLPLDSISGEILKVGGAIEIGSDPNPSCEYPIDLDWADESTFVSIIVY